MYSLIFDFFSLMTINNYVVLIFLLLIPSLITGQVDVEWSSKDIATMESRRFKKDLYDFSKSNENGSEYDWKYAECYWNIDPWVKYISGRVAHTIDVFQPTDTIYFDFSDALTVNGITWNSQSLTSFFRDQLTLGIVFPESVSGEQIIDIQYEGVPVANSYLSFVQSFHGMDPEIYTLSEPFGARDWWPCKQSMNDKLDSIFIEITIPNGQKAGSNGILEYVNDNVDGTQSYGWKHRYPIPAYLVSLAVTNYAEYTQTIPVGDHEIFVLNYLYPERLEQEQERSTKLPGLMTLFSEKFGLYPYADEKYGHSQSSIPGGMEHTTMSTMANLNFSLMAHELAHQWFGNKVTCGSWGDIWLNEGFATFMTGMAYENLTSEDMWMNWKSGTQTNIKSRPGGSVAIQDTTSRNEIFDGRLTYDKAAYVLHMLRGIMGDEDFFLACKNYLNDPKLAFGYARTPDLIAHLENVYGKSLSGFFNDWYYGEGFPTYSLRWTPAVAGVVITLNQTTSHPSVGFFEMPVPIQLFGDQRDTIIKVDHTFSGQSFYLQPGFDVLDILVDPELWILANKEVFLDPDSDIDINALSFHPNPAISSIHVSIRNPSFHADKMEIMDYRGRRILSSSPSGGIRGSFEIDVSEFAAGFYVLRLSNGSHAKTGSFVVVRP